ncbi:MAG TPA: hypothetical protein VF699_02320 [Caulobacteraceae bacterium]
MFVVSWFSLQWSDEGLREAREDVSMHFGLAALWIMPAVLTLAARPPRTRGRALLVGMAWALGAALLNVTLFYRYVADDLGMPPGLARMVTFGVAIYLLLVQAALALPAAWLTQQAILRRHA